MYHKWWCQIYIYKGEKWDFKVFLFYDVMILKRNTCVISCDPPFIGMYLRNLHFSIVSEVRVTFVAREITNKNNQFSIWETWIFNAILDQTKLWRVLLWIRIYFISFLNLLVWVSAMQCNIECSCLRKGNASRCNIKRAPPPYTPGYKEIIILYKHQIYRV